MKLTNYHGEEKFLYIKALLKLREKILKEFEDLPQEDLSNQKRVSKKTRGQFF